MPATSQCIKRAASFFEGFRPLARVRSSSPSMTARLLVECGAPAGAERCATRKGERIAPLAPVSGHAVTHQKRMATRTPMLSTKSSLKYSTSPLIVGVKKYLAPTPQPVSLPKSSST
jgi:hypothetical protein